MISFAGDKLLRVVQIMQASEPQLRGSPEELEIDFEQLQPGTLHDLACYVYGELGIQPGDPLSPIEQMNGMEGLEGAEDGASAAKPAPEIEPASGVGVAKEAVASVDGASMGSASSGSTTVLGESVIR